MMFDCQTCKRKFRASKKTAKRRNYHCVDCSRKERMQAKQTKHGIDEKRKR